MVIFIPGEPARVTEQQHRYGGRKQNGQVIIYRDPRLAAARNELLYYLKRSAPADPLTGPIKLNVQYEFGCKTKKLWGTWKTTRPDTDNLIKGLKDCMTEAGFWKDDSQVVYETVIKHWCNPDHAGIVIALEVIE